MNRPTISLLMLLTIAALMLNSCSSSEETDPVGSGPAPTPLAVTDLTAVGGNSATITLAWTSPQYADKATIRYDLRYIAFGSESADWDSWTVERAPESDSAPGQEHRHVVTSLTSGQVYAFGLKVSTDGVEWTEISNLTVATAALVFDTTPPAPITGLFQYRGGATSVTMAWPVAGDDGIYGQATSYEARYWDIPITPANWTEATPVPGSITASSVPQMMETEITGLTPDQDFYVAVKATDDQGLVSGLSNVLTAQAIDRTTLYVNIEGTGDYPTIEEAVQAATIGDVVLVGPGRYTWANQATGDSLYGMIHVPRYYPDDDYYDFEMRSLAGAEATILDAQFHASVMAVTGGSDGAGQSAGITIDGFTFTNGKAKGEESNSDEGYGGGGLALHLTDTVVRNCIFTGNEATQGGGLWVGGVGDSLIENCLFENNRARDGGGGVMLINSSLRITMRDCTIRNNHVTFLGGGLAVKHAVTTLENLLIVGNDSSDKGGGIYFWDLNPDCEMIRCTVAGNDANTGSGIMLESVAEDLDFRCESSVVAFNTGSAPFSLIVFSWLDIGCTLVFGNDVNNLLPSNSTDLGGNFEADPLFCDQVDYLLQENSPCLPGNHPGGNDCGTVGAKGAGCGI